MSSSLFLSISCNYYQSPNEIVLITSEAQSEANSPSTTHTVFTTLFFPVRAKSTLSLGCRSGENVQENKRSSKSSGLQMIPSTLSKCRKKQPIYFPGAPFHVGNQWTNNRALKPKLDSNTCECCMFIV